MFNFFSDNYKHEFKVAIVDDDKLALKKIETILLELIHREAEIKLKRKLKVVVYKLNDIQSLFEYLNNGVSFHLIITDVLCDKLGYEAGILVFNNLLLLIQNNRFDNRSNRLLSTIVLVNSDFVRASMKDMVNKNIMIIDKANLDDKDLLFVQKKSRSSAFHIDAKRAIDRSLETYIEVLEKNEK